MQRVLYKIDKEWDTGIVNIQEYVNLVDIVHKDYYDLLYKFLSSEYKRGKRIAENRVNRKITSMVTKSDTPVYLKPDYKTGLTGTITSTEQSLEDLTFTASEKTLNRVKQDKISKVLTEGYRKGLNGTEVGRHIKVEFGKLKTSEAVRIARTELHSAHEKGLIDQYKSMDVQYVQWDAHIDNRTRDTHIDLDGEITSIDGHFSNGLAHPGDKNGAISEWIHCRCTLQPYLMPLGKKPPAGATYFREDDLVDADTGFDITKYTLDDALSGNWGETNVVERALTPRQQKIYFDLLEDKTKGELLDDEFLEELEERIELYKLHKKKIKGVLSENEQQRYSHLDILYGDDRSAKETAEHFGLELDIDDLYDNYIFYDPKHDCKIIIPSNHSCIDFRNEDYEFYDLKRVLEIYDNAHSIKKYATNRITFLDGSLGDGVLGVAHPLGKVEPKSIEIGKIALTNNKYKRGNLAQTLYHEMGHCVDFSFTPPEIVKLLEENATDEATGKITEWGLERLRNVKGSMYNQIKSYLAHPEISYSKEYNDIVEKTREYQKRKGYKEEASSWYGIYEGGAVKYHEDFAEAISMADFHFLSEKERQHGVLADYNGESVPFDKWCEWHKPKYDYIVELLERIKPLDFTF